MFDGAQIYRVEFETSGQGMGTTMDSLHDREAACAVCQAPAGREYSVVVPGRLTCPSGYSQDYRGYLMAEHRGHPRSDFICVDESPDRIGSTGNENGALIYAVEMGDTRTGYPLYQEMTCTHCTITANTGSLGSSYTRIGREDCPSGHTLQWKGLLAGSYYNAGGGGNLFCLHPEPQYLRFDARGEDGSRVYATEYETNHDKDRRISALHDREVPCAQCQRPGRSPIGVMIPGRTSCPAGYSQDVTGYLMSEKHDHGKGTFRCVDVNMFSVGSSSSQNGALLYLVEMQGDASFQQYPDFWQLSCVICSACGADTYSAGGACRTISKCGRGQYQTAPPTATSDRVCGACPSGTYQSASSHTQTSCTACPGTQYQPAMGQSSCKACSTGYYSTDRKAQTLCQAGYKCASCRRTACDAGTFQNSAGQTTCKACSGATYQPSSAQASCETCSVGYYRSSATAQTRCQAGYKCPGSCARNECPAGTYQNAAGKTTCTGCPSNQYQDLARQTSCKACTAGYYRSSASAQTKCQPGYSCSGCARKACGSGTFQNEAGKTSCATISRCGKGQRVTKAATLTSDTVCGGCSLGNTFQDKTSHLDTSCKAVRKCQAGTFQSRAPTVSSDRVCSACDGVTKFQSTSGATSCSTVRMCGKGQYASSPPTASSDRVCSSCTQGVTFQASTAHATTSCDRVRAACGAGTRQTAAPTLSSNRACQTCDAGTYQNLAGQTSCKKVTTCKAGERESTKPTTTSDRACAGCDGVNNYQSQPGQTRCLAVTVCSSGQYEATAPTTTSNRVCRACTTGCPAGQFLSGPCGGSSNPQCVACHPTCETCRRGTASNQCTSCEGDFKLVNGRCVSDCDDGEYEDGKSCLKCAGDCHTCDGPGDSCLSCSGSLYLTDRACKSACPRGRYRSTRANDNQCLACSKCPPGKWAAAACSGGTDTACLDWTTCKAGEEQAIAPDAATDRKCVPCGKDHFQDQAGQKVCKAKTICGPGEYVSSAGSATQDRKCLPCLPGSFQGSANQAQCIDCPAGRYQKNGGEADCVDCGTGKFQPKTGSTSCSTIKVGFYGAGGDIGVYSTQKACEPGYACPGGKSARRSCDGVTEYQDQAGQAECKPITKCAAGQLQAAPPAADRNRKCDACDDGEYQPSTSHAQTSCAVHSRCRLGEFQVSAPTASSDRVCRACDGVKGYADEQVTSCKPVTTCGAGSSMVQPPTASSDRVCRNCIAGSTFQDGVNQDSCIRVRQCAAGSKQSRAPTASQDRLCAFCDGVNEYQDQDGQTSCKRVSRCAAGQYQTASPTATSDRRCASCRGATYQDQTSHSSVKCDDHTVCQAGEYVKVAGTSKADTVCAACGPGTFQDQPGQTACRKWRTCAAGTRVTTLPTRSTDRVCSACPTGTFQDASDHTSSTCAPFTVCKAGSRERAPPTRSSDRSCANCDGVNFYQDVDAQTRCKSATLCQNGTEYTATPPTAASDRVCKPCTANCPRGSFLTGECGPLGGLQNRRCVNCHPSCATCTTAAASACLSCPDGLKLRSGRCVSDCPDGEYADGGNQCRKCDASCQLCDGAGPGKCIACAGKLFLDLGTTSCKATCPSGTYPQASLGDNRCRACSQCPGGQFEAVKCGAGGDTQCRRWTECKAGEEQSVAPSKTADRKCKACDGVTKFQDEPGQISCKAVSSCRFPDVEKDKPTASSDRTCTCDLVQCSTLVGQVYEDVLCARPTASQQARSVNDCCEGQASSVLEQLLRLSDDFKARHSCDGCTSSCSCTQGYQQAATQGGTVCKACDGATSFAADDGATKCTAVTRCKKGHEEQTAPTISSDRVCRECPLGSSDVEQSGEKCTTCGPGTYVPPGSFGACSTFACPAGSVDHDGDSRTACVACVPGVGFQGAAGKTACTPTTECKAGEEEIVQPTAQRDRVCKSCLSGVNFKASPGGGSCLSVRNCQEGEEEATAPTASTDRSCRTCQAGATFKADVGNQAKCVAVTECKAGEEERREPTTFSDRQCVSCITGVSFKLQPGQRSSCQPVRRCDADEYETNAPTVTSDRSCTKQTRCDDGAFESTQATATSDRKCTACTTCPSNRFTIAQCTATQDTVCEGCKACLEGKKYQLSACTSGSDTICTSCRVCEEGLYQVSACTQLQNTACAPQTQCKVGQEYQTKAPTATSDRACTPYSPKCGADEYESTAPTATSDRRCSKLTRCQPGEEEDVRPGASNNRRCIPCPAGTTDSDGDGATRCKACPAGTFTKAGSQGTCESHACAAGQADADKDPATPCTSCEFGKSYSPAVGRTECRPVTDCDAGFMELVPPTLFADRICLECTAGVTFKAAKGQASSCGPVTRCTLGESYETKAPTTTSDRQCEPVTACDRDTEYETRVPTLLADRECDRLTVCVDGEFQALPPSSTSDRECEPVTECDFDQEYELTAPGLYSDRLCAPLTECQVDQIETVAKTKTSDRTCTDVFQATLFFDADYDTAFPDDAAVAGFKANLTAEAALLGVEPTSIARISLFRGSIVASVEFTVAADRKALHLAVAAENVTVSGHLARLCAEGSFMDAPPTGTTGPVCEPMSQCKDNEFIAIPGGPLADNECKVVTECVEKQQYEAAPPTESSDRVCKLVTLCGKDQIEILEPTPTSNRKCIDQPTLAPTEAAASGSGDEKTGGASLGMIIGIVLAFIILLAVIIGVVIVKRRNDELKHNRVDAMMVNAGADVHFLEGNEMLRQLTLTRKNNPAGVTFDNPMFAGQTAVDAHGSASWLCGAMSRPDAEVRLRELGGQPGDFVVRESPNNNCHVLSMINPEGVAEHHRLQLDSRFCYQIQGQSFRQNLQSLPDVVRYLSHTMDGTTVLLNVPVEASSQDLYGPKVTAVEQDLYGPKMGGPPDGRPVEPWNKGGMNRKEAEAELSRMAGGRGSFLVRDSRGKNALSVSLGGGAYEHHILEQQGGRMLLNGEALPSHVKTVDDAVYHLLDNRMSVSVALNGNTYSALSRHKAARDSMTNDTYSTATDGLQAQGDLYATSLQEDSSARRSLANPGYAEPDGFSNPNYAEQAGIGNPSYAMPDAHGAVPDYQYAAPGMDGGYAQPHVGGYDAADFGDPDGGYMAVDDSPSGGGPAYMDMGSESRS